MLCSVWSFTRWRNPLAGSDLRTAGGLIEDQRPDIVTIIPSFRLTAVSSGIRVAAVIEDIDSLRIMMHWLLSFKTSVLNDVPILSISCVVD